ncbi:MAG: LysR substrate-binding domain-containing protein [Gammaproteobacteria bacterium]|jgi:LysR family hydrogen peroxide-inducible transcriptional activator
MKAISSGISIRALGYLVALAEEKHFGRAAERCHVSQPTLSAQIKKLEEQLEVRLVERSQRRVMLTDIGAEIVERARRVLQEVDAVCEIARSYQDPLSGELRIGLIPTVGPYLLPMVAPVLRKALPRLRLYLVEHQTADLLAALDNGRVDMAVLALPAGQDGLEIQPLYSEPFLAALPAGHPLCQRPHLKIHDLDGETLLLLEDGHCLRDQALEVCGKININEPQDFRATSLETLRQMVASGLGVTLLPRLATEHPFGRTPGLVVRPLRNPVPDRTVAGVWRRTSPRSATIQEICGVIRETMAKKKTGVRSA